MRTPSLSLWSRRWLAAALALSAGARFAAAQVIVGGVPGGISVSLPAGLGTSAAPSSTNGSLILPSAQFTRDLAFQLGRLSPAPALAAPAAGAPAASTIQPPLSVRLQTVLQAQLDAGVPRDQAVATQNVLVQALADPKVLASVQEQLRQDPLAGRAAAGQLGALAADARTVRAQAELRRYARALGSVLAASLAGDAGASARLFDGLLARAGDLPGPAVRADGGRAAATGSETLARLGRRGLPTLERAPAASGRLDFSPALQERYGAALERYGADVGDDAFAGFAPLVRIHLQSHLGQADEWLDAGLLSPTVHAFARGFIRDHDGAYAFSKPGDVEGRAAELKEVWTTIALALSGGDRAAAARRADETYARMRDAFDAERLARVFQTEAGVPEKAAQGMALGYGALVGTILGHGSMSVVETKRRLEAAGIAPRAALGFALLVALHHPNFPITLVHGLSKGLTSKAPSLAVPDRLLGPLLIREGRALETDDMTPAQKEEVRFRDSEALRAKVSAYAAGLIGISPAEARLISVLGYALDRVTAARRNTPDARDFRVVDGKPAFVSWNAPGAPLGEIVKKYGLILTNIMGVPDIKTSAAVREFNLRTAFAKTLESLETETRAAVRAAQAALAEPGLTPHERRQLRTLERAAADKSREEILRTRAIQDAVLAYAASGRIAGFSGLSVDLDEDIALVRAHAEKIGPESGDYGTVSYLLSALVAMRTGGTNQAVLAALAQAPR